MCTYNVGVMYLFQLAAPSSDKPLIIPSLSVRGSIVEDDK
jgi:hypothetical protein